MSDNNQGTTSTKKKKVPAVVVSKGKARLFKDGNPLIYGGAIQSVRGNPGAGDLVQVDDVHGNTFAWGVFNPHSMYRVRVLERAGEGAAAAAAAGEGGPPLEMDLPGLLGRRIRAAQALRRALGLPRAAAATGGGGGGTTAYRLVNGEGDRLSGLVVDVFGATVAVSSSALWVERWRDEIEAALLAAFEGGGGEEGGGQAPAVTLVWRQSESRLRQDGWGAGEEGGGRAEGEEGGGRTPVRILDRGVRYEVRPALGQKTGFYCDQRDNRALVRELAEGREVLDMFCYTGGFSLNAALGGATAVTGVDSSALAVSTAERNAALNGLEDDPRLRFVRADAYKFLAEAAAEGRAYDLIVLDPPKLAPNKKALVRARRKYERLNAAALRLLRPGGLLFTFTCSAAMAQSGDFVNMVRDAAGQAGASLTLLRAVGAAPDHCLNPAYPEGEYLEGALLYRAPP